ncbi:MAG: tRNA pseudouridine(38-40) synthase TruA [Chlorobi bacterium]|nr:tRNA pseudouridine(38-40) synthase TruA [Chlorobiota bacterium]
MQSIQRYFLEISFIGTNYHGWQIQPNAITIQEILDKTLSTFLKEEIITVGAGRTDAGVHAEYFIIHFDSIKQNLHLNKNFLFRINQFLPIDIAVKKIEQVEMTMHARFSAKLRTYEYRITSIKNPFLNNLTHYYYGKLNIQLMNSAAEILKMHKDFTSFSKIHSDVKTHICYINQAIWTKTGDLLVFRISADRFLRNMVRAIVGSMIEIGREKIDLVQFEKIIIAKDRTKAGFSAPAKGLFLTNIQY